MDALHTRPQTHTYLNTLNPRNIGAGCQDAMTQGSAMGRRVAVNPGVVVNLGTTRRIIAESYPWYLRPGLHPGLQVFDPFGVNYF